MVFAVEAGRYWDKGISVIPVLGKRPILKDWSKWAHELPSKEEQQRWIETYSGDEVGIGLVCGPVSGIMAVDIDSDDPKVLSIIEGLLPRSPWERVGRRGKVLAYKFRNPRNFSLKQGRGEGATSIVDILASKKQFVLPPSIHPDTGKPYWANCDLLDVLGELREVPEKFDDHLRAAFEAEGIDVSSTRGETITATKWVAVGARDSTMMSLCGLYAKEVIDGKWNLLRQIEDIQAWAIGQTEKVWGDALAPEKAVDRLIYCLRQDVLVGGKTLPVGWDEGLTDEMREGLGIADLGEEHRRWSYTEIAQWFDEQIGKEGVLKDAGVLHDVVEKTIQRMAANPDLDTVQTDWLFKHINSVTAGAYRIVALRQQLKDLTRGKSLGETHAEAATMLLEILEKDGEVRYWEGKFWRWGGACWMELKDTEIERLVIEHSRGMQSTKKNNDYVGVAKTMRGLRHRPLREVAIDGVNFVNGYLTKELKLLGHHPDHGCTYVLPYPYDPALADECHLWQGMLWTYWGKDADYKEKVQGLREAMAATIFGVAPRFQRAFCFQGVRFAGKTQIIHTMVGLMPPGSHCSVPPEKFSEKFESTELAGKLLNYAGELDEKHPINAKMFKMVVEGSEIQGQFKNKPVFAYKPKAAHWFGSNAAPRADSWDGGFERRWLFFKFDHPLDPADRIPDLAERVISEEAPAVMSWAVQGITDLLKRNDYVESQGHKECLEDMKRKNDSVLFWLGHLREHGRVRYGVAEHSLVTKKFTSVEDLFRAYRLFCSSVASAQHVSLQTFIARMVDQGIFREFSPIRGVTGGITGFYLITFVDAPAG